MFNWRMKFPLNLPGRFERLKIQVWDKDYLNPNDAICEANLNLKVGRARTCALSHALSGTRVYSPSSRRRASARTAWSSRASG